MSSPAGPWLSKKPTVLAREAAFQNFLAGPKVHPEDNRGRLGPILIRAYLPTPQATTLRRIVESKLNE